MGVMADLSGKPAEPLPPVADRKFLEIDVDNFDERMKAMKPAWRSRCRTRSPAKATSTSTSPSRAWTTSRPLPLRKKVPVLNKLLEARQQLANLITYMDGKTGAEELIAKVLKDPALLQTLASAPKSPEESQPDTTEKKS